MIKHKLRCLLTGGLACAVMIAACAEFAFAKSGTDNDQIKIFQEESEIEGMGVQEEYLTEDLEGLTVNEDARGKVTVSEAEGLLEEYGKDSNIIIYDVGYTKQYEQYEKEITGK